MKIWEKIKFWAVVLVLYPVAAFLYVGHWYGKDELRRKEK